MHCFVAACLVEEFLIFGPNLYETSNFPSEFPKNLIQMSVRHVGKNIRFPPDDWFREHVDYFMLFKFRFRSDIGYEIG